MITEVQKTQILQYTVSMFKGAPGASVMAEFSAYIEGGGSMQQLFGGLSESSFFTDIYPASLTNQQFAINFINSLADVSVAQQAKDNMANEIVLFLNAGGTRGDAIYHITNALVNCPESDPTWGKTAQQFNNKVDVARYYTITKGYSGDNITDLQNVIVGVTADDATVTLAEKAVDSNIVTKYGDSVQKAYIAYYGRPADPVGLQYWSEKLGAVNGDWKVIIDSFGNSQEATLLMANLNNEQKVNLLFNQLYGRDADVDGLKFYSLKLAEGAFTTASLAINIMTNATGSDLTVLNNKLATAKLFTTDLDTTQEIISYNSDSVSLVRSWLANFKNVQGTKDQVDSFITTLPNIQEANYVFNVNSANVVLNNSSNFGTDKSNTSYYLHAGKDQINSANLLANQSVIQDSNINDDDILNYTNNTAIVSPIISNIETISIVSYNQGINLQNANGYNTIKTSGVGTVDIQNIATGKTVEVSSNGITTVGLSGLIATATATLKLNGGVDVAYDDNGINGVGNKVDTTELNSIGSTENTISLTNAIATALNVIGTQNLTVKAIDAQVDGETITATNFAPTLTVNITNETNGMDLSKTTGVDVFNFTNAAGLVGNDDVFTASNGVNIVLTPTAVATTHGNISFVGDAATIPGSSDVANITLAGTTVGVGNINSTNFETLTINSNGSAATTIGTVSMAVTPFTETVKFAGNVALTSGVITTDTINAINMTADFTMSGITVAGHGAVIYGGSGKNTLAGSVNDDAIYGGSANDIINGNGGSDQIFISQGGSDVIRNSTGTDIVYGFDKANDIFDINYALVSNNGTALDLAGFGTTKAVAQANVLNLDSLTIGSATGYAAGTDGIFTIKSNLGTLTSLTETDFRSVFGVGGTAGALTVGTNDQGKFIVVAYDGTTSSANGAAFLVDYSTSVDGSKVIEAGDTVTLIGTFNGIGADGLTYTNLM